MDAEVFQRLKGIANEDSEFRCAARFWTATLRLDHPDRSLALRIENGEFREASPCSPEAPCDASISASAEGWRRFLAATPRPFYQDLFGAMSHHGFAVGGDFEGLCAYYPAVRRLFDLARQARKEV